MVRTTSSRHLLSILTVLSDRGFKALKQSTKILYLTLHRPEEALETYRELLGYVKVCLQCVLVAARLTGLFLVCRDKERFRFLTMLEVKER
jgi:hypothetical protein